jgi:hypothetical protein
MSSLAGTDGLRFLQEERHAATRAPEKEKTLISSSPVKNNNGE